MGAEVYSQMVVERSHIGCLVRKLQKEGKGSLQGKFNIASGVEIKEIFLTGHKFGNLTMVHT